MFSGSFSNSTLATDTLISGVFKQIFQCFGGISVVLLERVSVDIKGHTGMSVSKAVGYSSDVLIAGDQQGGRSVAQTVKWNDRQFCGFLLSLIVAIDGILKSLVWSAVVHHGSGACDEEPVISFPIVAPDQLICFPGFL